MQETQEKTNQAPQIVRNQGQFIDNFNLLVDEIVKNAKDLTLSTELSQLSQYSSLLKLDQDGVCFGLSSKFVEMKFKGQRAEFFKYVECIANLTKQDRTNLIKYKQIVYNEVTFKLSDLIVFAAQVLSYHRTQVKDPHQFVKLIGAKCINSTTFITNAKNLTEDFLKNGLAENNAVLGLSSANHRVVVEKEGEDYCIYEPNYSGQTVKSTLKALIAKINRWGSLKVNDSAQLGITVDILSKTDDKILSEIMLKVKGIENEKERFANLISQFENAAVSNVKIAQDIVKLFNQNDDAENKLKLAVETYLNNKLTSVQIYEQNRSNLTERDKLFLLDLAIKEDDKQLINHLLQEELNLNIEIEEIQSPLIYAIQMRNVELVKILLEKGADPNLKTDKQKFSPLMTAIVLFNANEDSLELVKLLLQYKVNVNEIFEKESNKKVYTPLTCVAQVSESIGNDEIQKQIIKLLKEKGADVNLVVNKDQQTTALHYAALSGNRKCYIELLKQGANPKLKNSDGKTAEQILIDKKIKSSFDELNQKDFHNAIMAGDKGLDDVKFWLTQGVNVNDQGPTGISELHWAVREKNIKALKALLSHPDIKLDVKNHSGLSPLQLAIWNKDKESFKELLAAYPNNSPNTVLNWAVQHGKTEWLTELLSKFNVDSVDEYGWTPLNWAIWNGNTAAITKILEKNPDVNKKDKQDWTPLHWAIYYNRPEMVKLLVDAKAKLDEKDSHGWSPLHWAVWNETECLNELLKSEDLKNCINIKDNEGWTPLHWANYYLKQDVVKKLENAGIDIAINNNQGISASEVGKHSQYLFQNESPLPPQDGRTKIHQSKLPVFLDVVLGIENYIKNDGKHLNRVVRFFDGERGLKRAKIYRDYLKDDTIPLVTRRIFLYSLLASNDGNTLKKYVIQALYGQNLSELEIKDKLKEYLDQLSKEISSKIPKEKMNEKTKQASIKFLNKNIISEIVGAVNSKRCPKKNIFENIETLFDLNKPSANKINLLNSQG